VFTAARGLLFFTVVVLIAAGWSLMKVGGCWGERSEDWAHIL
jgi:hypothetical protein